jgi:hypothetical protein
MRASVSVAAAVLILVVTVAGPSTAGLIDIGIGVYGGLNRPIEDDASSGSMFGAKVRVVPPIPMVGFEGYYTRMNTKDPEGFWNDASDIDIEDGDFDVAGLSVLIGNVGGIGGLKFFGVAGVNFVQFAADGSDSEWKSGGDLGAGAEFELPLVGLAAEVRGTYVILGWGKDRSLWTASAGVNYYF